MRLFFALILFYSIAGFAHAVEKPLLSGDVGNQPVTISADRLEADDAARNVRFVGHVVVRRGDVSLYANDVQVTYLPERKEIDRIVARGDVRIVQNERIATAQEAILLQRENKVILTGNARLLQGQNSVQGEEVTVFLNEEKSVIKSAPGGRVNAVFHPDGNREVKP